MLTSHCSDVLTALLSVQKAYQQYECSNINPAVSCAESSMRYVLVQVLMMTRHTRAAWAMCLLSLMTLRYVWYFSLCTFPLSSGHSNTIANAVVALFR